MKSIVKIIFVVGCFILFFALDGMAYQRVALVVGNSNYAASPLRNPANDAKDMAALLKQCGFKVYLKTNASHRTMERSIREFGKQLKNSKVGLFYYAGHGIQAQGRNYLIPIGSEIESQGDVKFEAVDAGFVLAKMEDAGNDLNIVILDACRNNPFARSFRSGQKGLARMDAPKGTLIAYATAPGSLASDGSGRNGVYTHHLINNIQNPQLSVEQVFKNVRVAVVKETSSRQIPWEASSLMGRFYFNEKAAVAVKKPAPAPKKEVQQIVVEKQPSKNSYEILFWESIKDSTDPQAFKAYQEQFPNGTFSKLAELNIARYGRSAAAQKPTLVASKRKPAPVVKRAIQETGIVSESEQFVEYRNGIVYDPNTNLEWVAGPDKLTNWYDAETWVQNLRLDGYWRMPTIEELRTLYKKKGGPRNMKAQLKMSGWYVWSSEVVMGEPAAKGFDFRVGQSFSYDYMLLDTSGDTTWYDGTGSTSARAFAVRNRK